MSMPASDAGIGWMFDSGMSTWSKKSVCVPVVLRSASPAGTQRSSTHQTWTFDQSTLSRAGDWPIAARTRDDTEPPLIAMSARSCSSSTSMIFVMKRAATEAPRACLSGCTSTRRSLVT